MLFRSEVKFLKKSALISSCVTYFQNQFSNELINLEEPNFDHFPSVPNEANMDLCRVPNLEELKITIWSMNKDAAPGPVVIP